MTTDIKELLELAAKLTGRNLSWMSNGKAAFVGDEIWSPHESNDDSRSLQVALRINLQYRELTVTAYKNDISWVEPLGDNPEVATCMVVLRCAAEIQRRKDG